MAGLFDAARLAIIVSGKYIPMNEGAILRDTAALERLNRAGKGGGGRGAAGAALGGGAAGGGFGGPAVVAGAALAIGIGVVTQQANDFERATQKVWANSQLTAKGFKQAREGLAAYRKELLDFSRQGGFSPFDANSVFFRGMNANFSGAYLKAFATAVLRSALPTGSNPESTALALSGIIKGFHLSTTNTNTPLNTMDIIHAAAATGQIRDVGQLINYFPRISRVAGSVNQPGGEHQALINALAIFTSLTKLGNTVSQTATLESMMYQYMIHPPGPGQKLIDTLAYNGTNSYQRNLYKDFSQWGMEHRGPLGILSDLSNAHLTGDQILKIMPGARSGTGLLQLLMHGDNSLVQSQAYKLGNQAHGVTDQAYALWLKTTNGQLYEFKANLQTIAIELGGPFNTALRSALSWANEWLKPFAQWMQDHPKMVSTILDETGKILLLAAGFKAVSLAIKLISASSLTSMWGLFGKLGTQSTAAATGLDKVSTAATGLTVSRLGTALTGLGLMATALKLMWDHTTGIEKALDGVINRLHKGLAQPLGSGTPDLGTLFLALLAGPVGGAKAYEALLNYINPFNGATGGSAGNNNGPVPLGGAGQSADDVHLRPGQYMARGAFGFSQKPGDINSYQRPLGPYNAGIWVGTPTGGHWINATDPAYFHEDLGTGGSGPHSFSLPGNASNAHYTVMGYRRDGTNPNLIDVSLSPDGGKSVFTLMHLTSFGSVTGSNIDKVSGFMGSTVNGGQSVGVSGLDHLHIGGDRGSLSFFSAADPANFSRGAGAYGYTATQAPPYATAWEKANWYAIYQAAQAYGVPIPIFLAMLMKESSGGTDARAGFNVAQITPGAGMGMPTSAIQSAGDGAQYLKQLYNQYGGSWQLALQHYNGSGPKAVAYGQSAIAIATGYGYNGGISTTGGSGSGTPPSPPPKPTLTWLQSLKNSQMSNHMGWLLASSNKWKIPIKFLEGVLMYLYGGHVQSAKQVDWVAWSLMHYYGVTSDWTVALADFIAGGTNGGNDPLAQQKAGDLLNFLGTPASDGGPGLSSLPGLTHTLPPGVKGLNNDIATQSTLMGGYTYKWKGVDLTNLPASGNHGINSGAYLADQSKYWRAWEKQQDDEAHKKFLLGQISNNTYQFRVSADKQYADRKIQAAHDALHLGGPSGRIVPTRIVGSCQEQAKTNTHLSATATASKQTAKHTFDTVKELGKATKLLSDLLNHHKQQAASPKLHPITGPNSQAAMRSHGTPTAAHPGS